MITQPTLEHERARVLEVLALALEEKRILERFDTYLIGLDGQLITFEGPDKDTGEFVTLKTTSLDLSRYSDKGRRKIMHKLRRRLDGLPTFGVLLTLTVDTKLYTRSEAWARIWKEFAAFRTRLWKLRKRLGYVANPGYMAVIETTKRGYPHLHVAYPGLYGLADVGALNRFWSMGSVDISGPRQQRRKGKAANVIGYLLKYVSKLSGWTKEALAHLWWSRSRLYSISHRLYVNPSPLPKPGWRFGGVEYENDMAEQCIRKIRVLRIIWQRRKQKKTGRRRGVLFIDQQQLF